jgi:transposase
LNFTDVKTVRLEHLKNVGKGQKKSKFLSSWTYPLIKEKLVRISELEGFQIEEMSNKFRSQRCNSCGYVNKANRKGKAFKCKHCSHQDDADLNSSLNLELDLPKVPNWVFEQKLNRSGFFWSEEGVFAEEKVIPLNEKTS